MGCPQRGQALDQSAESARSIPARVPRSPHDSSGPVRSTGGNLKTSQPLSFRTARDRPSSWSFLKESIDGTRTTARPPRNTWRITKRGHRRHTRPGDGSEKPVDPALHFYEEKCNGTRESVGGGSTPAPDARATHRSVGAEPTLHQRAPATQPLTQFVNVPIGLSATVRLESVTALNQVLADTMVLRDLYKKHHWQTSGATFISFNEQAELMDAIAERIQTRRDCDRRRRHERPAGERGTAHARDAGLVVVGAPARRAARARSLTNGSQGSPRPGSRQRSRFPNAQRST